MKKAVLPAVLGLLSPFIFILGAEPFEVHGRTSSREILAGSLVLALYLAACQFWVARDGNQGLKARWPTIGPFRRVSIGTVWETPNFAGKPVGRLKTRRSRF